MKQLGYGKGYRYDPESASGVSDQRYLPERLATRRFYQPGVLGFEKTLADRIRWFDERRGAE